MHLYAGIFLIALSTLAIEITLVRLLSVITWYHLAFFAISTAMLGMTAGAVTVYVRQHWFAGPKLERSVGLACIAYALITPVALVLLNLLPLGFERSGVNAMTISAFALATVLCSLPFYCSGIAISALLTLSRASIGRLYAADLIGAAAGCLLVLGGLALLDAPSLILFCAALGGLAAFILTTKTSKSVGYWGLSAFFVLAVLTSLNNGSPSGVRPLVVKEQLVDPNRTLLERWNSHSQVVVDRPTVGPPQYWGPSSKAPADPIPQFWMRIDGSAGTSVRGFSALADIEHLRYDITNAAYYLRGSGGACIIGVGGGRDLQGALLFGHEHVTGVDVNHIFIDLLQNEFAEFVGLANREDVTLVADEARSYLARTDQRFSIIQMSLVDTWAATGAGAFSFSENALYTVEGWQIFLSRLKDDGIFTVSRWHDPENLGETGRLLSLATATLLTLGADPAKHLAMLTSANLSTLLLSRQPLSTSDIETLRRLSADLDFHIAVLPDRTPDNAELRAIVSADSLDALHAAVDAQPLNYSPPTDDSPYFFNMLKLGDLAAVSNAPAGVLRGNLTATITLLSLLAALAGLSALTIVLPLVLKKITSHAVSEGAKLWPAAMYFALIGAGFMFTEIGLIQRLSVFLGHPIYALGVILFTIILSTGVGSSLSDLLRDRERPPLLLAIAAAAAIVIVQYALLSLLNVMTSSSMMSRILASVAIIAPLGLLLGLFFPLGMRLAKSMRLVETSWLWALNGVFGVLASAAAVFVAIYLSISANFLIGAFCYLLVAATGMLSYKERAAETLATPTAVAE